MTDIVFGFDTEDYVNPGGADDLLTLCNLLESENVRGCFNIVGRFAEALEKWGRQDVIEALKRHEIDTQSLAHTFHPTINEYTDREDYGEAHAEFRRQETECAEILKRVFGFKDLVAACPPGANSSYVAYYGYAEMGCSLYAGTFTVDQARFRPLNLCNIWNTAYACDLEDHLLIHDQQGLLDHLEKIAKTKSMFTFANHPNMITYTDFWDLMNYNKKNTDPEDWIPAPPRDRKDVDRFFENLRFLIRAIKADPRFRITTYETIIRELDVKRVITREQIPGLRSQLEEDWFPVTLPGSFCLADLFHACRTMLSGAEEYECGFVRGFLEEPFAITGPVTVTREEMIASARTVPAEGWLPRQINVGAQVLGPADWLRAALAVLCGEETVTLSPAGWQIDLDQLPMLRDLDYSKIWQLWIDLQDNHLSRRLRMQTWTLRLPEGTCRKIF